MVTGKNHYTTHASGGAVYGLGFIGALVYFTTHGVGFWGVILGILKAIVWPAFLIYGLLDFLKL